MADTGRRMTDAEFRRLRAKIKGVYQQAYEDIYKKNLDFVKRHERREAQYRQMMDEGRITKTDFDMWMRGQVFQGKQWEAKRKQMEATLLNADQMAMDMINGSRVRVFADNANFIGYELEQHGRVDTSFGLYDINSVKRLLMEEPDLLPPRSVGKDESYKWYNKQIQGAVTQGIIQGEKLTDIAKRIGQVTGERCMNAMLRNARTMHTGAENAGRIEGMHQAQQLGIEVQKKWLATLDGHTRDAHRDLDGQVRDVDKPFDSSMGKIRFPGDATAYPGLVWNCRCTLTYVYPKYPDSMAQRRDNETGEVIDDMTYREWEHWKQTGEMPKREPIHKQNETVIRIPDRQETQPQQQPRIEQPETDYFDMDTSKDISKALSQKLQKPIDLSGMDKTLAARTARLYERLVDEYGLRASSIGMNNSKAAFGQVNHKYTGEKKLTFSKNLFKSTDSLRNVLMQEQRKGQTIPIRGGTILDYVQTHEFAHLFGNSVEDGYNNYHMDFWREIGAVMREYIEDRTRPLGKYAASNIDEFLAESFADGYLNARPTQYGERVKKIVDKYFRRKK